MSSRIDIERDLVLLLTASVDPQGMPGVTRPDPRQREQDYAGCLRYYVGEHPRIRRIAFVENSGWPLQTLQQAAESANRTGKTLEFVSLDCNDFPRARGKSYGEAVLMERGLKASALLREAKYVAKLTGRNYLMNLTRIIERAPDPLAMMCDVRDHRLYQMVGLNWCGQHADTRLVIFTPEFFERFVKPRIEQLDESRGRFLENLFFDLVKHPPPGYPVVRRFKVEPDYRGLAGHWNKDYGSGREVMKRRVRAAARRVVPWLHI